MRVKKPPPPASLAALAALTNLGPVSARWLYDAGIRTPTALRRLGPVTAFRKVAIHRGGDVSLNLLYALDGALRGKRWDHLPRHVRERLRESVNTPED